MQTKTKQRIAVQYFLITLKKKMQDQKVLDINPVWKKIFDKEELKKIVIWLHPQALPEEMEIDKMSKQELINEIADEYLILCYLLDQMTAELEAFNTPTNETVQTIFRQLGLQTHYLATKPIDLWDKYDLANYKAHSVASGNPKPMYAVFNDQIEEDEKYLVSPMGKLHELESDAQSEIFHYVMENEEVKVKTMML